MHRGEQGPHPAPGRSGSRLAAVPVLLGSASVLNMLYLLEVFRGQGHGRRLMRFWEREMQKRGCSMVLTSRRSDERAQGFYRKLGYRDCGALLLPEEPLEIILFKKI
ncbi:MAG: GNAT family N-acetyltransferase [Oscillospiraceae bacterium]|nr:GNAT family N-acetyltransferase [Oscillospiraceae bacterium]